jgi:hypothetical protein
MERVHLVGFGHDGLRLDVAFRHCRVACVRSLWSRVDRFRAQML